MSSSGQQHYLAVGVARFQIAEGIANLLQRVGARDRDFEASVGHHGDELGEQRRCGDRVGALPVDAESLTASKSAIVLIRCGDTPSSIAKST